ncbi:hypothetical protein BX600DRAFT_555031 [Xylariales sp. PMI_506]|nr:hypothetical protein BX600DRAFT_555031 [Xylariales sp. PMI_506]
MAAFAIPVEYTDRLEPVELPEWPSHTEILQRLNHYAPVKTEKNIWTFWHSGVTEMPAWCQRNVVDWARICGPEWTVRVLDNVTGSPNYALNADIVRGAALYSHGGVWMDVGSTLSRHIERICWNQLQDPDSPYQIAAAHMFGPMIANFFVAARKRDPFVKRWHELFLYFFKDRTNLKGSIQDPLFAFGQALFSVERLPQRAEGHSTLAHDFITGAFAEDKTLPNLSVVIPGGYSVSIYIKEYILL